MEGIPKKTAGLRRILSALGYSQEGLRAAYKNEAAFKQEVWLGLVLLIIAIVSATSPLEKILLIGSMLLVLIVELFNSALEATVDYISLEYHPLAKRAKDMCSAAVLIAFMNLIFVWGCIFGSKFWH